MSELIINVNRLFGWRFDRFGKPYVEFDIGNTLLAIIPLLLVLAVPLLIFSSISLAKYIGENIGYQKILKKRGYLSPWHMWIPFLRTYVKGSLADDINIKSNKRPYLGKTLAILIICQIVLMVTAFWGMVSGISLLMVVSLVFLTFVAIVVDVIKYISIYKIYDDYLDSYAIPLFIVSIFIPIIEPIAVIIAGEKESRTMSGV